ncbi:hypothetical protein DPMN_069393 [Dreissena polymorpha]|uniref:Uncharacterized protein n=1 Tax=Dreissena polymorpha TaxID=45954 RepID=A0A9D3Z117_DREPO|nr:hypothetical protein DPMN_069393 [Dreissena polymorpha]
MGDNPGALDKKQKQQQSRAFCEIALTETLVSTHPLAKSTMSVRGRSVRRRVGQAVEKRRQRGGRGCGRQLIRTRRRNKGPRWRRRNAAETAPLLEPASAHVPGSKTEAELAAAPPSKRKRADDNAANGEVDDLIIYVTFSAQPMGYHVVTTWVSTRH